jgi:transcriptional regulator with XRE-family HTH domain
METTYIEVGPEIRRRREAQKRTLRQVADAAKIDFGYLGKIERGANASTGTIEAIAVALGTDIASLYAVAKRRLVRRRAPRQVPQPNE